MRYLALAADYDGTLAKDGHVDDRTIEALERLIASGRKTVLVTGRELGDLMQVFPRLDVFDWVVAENGLLLYQPATKREILLAEPPPEALVAALEAKGVAPLSIGRSIVATWEPHQVTALETIRELGLEYQVVFNKGAVMVLPSGLNKGTGLAAALEEMRLSQHNVAGIGDAENDHAFLEACECSVAVANALPLLKERANLVTQGERSEGVIELVDRILEDDLASLEPALAKRRVLLGYDRERNEVTVPAYGPSILIAGPSGSGKSTAAMGLLERLAKQRYQFCVVDPEGDYESFAGALTIGDTNQAPDDDLVLEVLDDPRESAVVNLLGHQLSDRPQAFARLLPRLQELRAKRGRPHWLVVDEAHHLLPAEWTPASGVVPQDLHSLIMITVHPEHLAVPLLMGVDIVIAVGKEAAATVRGFCESVRAPVPEVPEIEPGAEVLAWFRESGRPPLPVRVEPAEAEHKRHRRKYAAGDLGEDRSFYFRGPDAKLNLQAQNLTIFLQMAQGIDEETWRYHLDRGDITRWFRDGVKDPGLAEVAAGLEGADLPAEESRNRIAAAIEERYTAPE